MNRYSEVLRKSPSFDSISNVLFPRKILVWYANGVIAAIIAAIPGGKK